MADSMSRRDYIYTNNFLDSYARAVVKGIKERTPIDTGELQAAINYKITYYRDNFNIYFAIGNGKFVKDSGLPSEYGTYLDSGDQYHYKGTRKKTKGWFSDSIPGLGQRYFLTNLAINVNKDRQIWMDTYIKLLQKESNDITNKIKRK